MSGSRALNGSVEKQDLRVDGEGPGQPDPLLHSAAKLVRVAVFPPGQPDKFDDFGGALQSLGSFHALDLQAVDHVVQHTFMREVAEVLEDHAHLVAADISQLALVHCEHVLTVDEDLAARWLDQPAETTYERGLAAAREAHDYERLAFAHAEGDVPDSQYAASLSQHLLPRKGWVYRVGKFSGSVSKDLPNVSADESRLSLRFSLRGWTRLVHGVVFGN